MIDFKKAKKQDKAKSLSKAKEAWKLCQNMK